MSELDKRAILEKRQPSRFIEVRNPKNNKLLFRYSPTTQEIEVKHKNEAPVVVNLKEYSST